MEQKIKIAVIGLVVLLFISFLIILGVLGSKQSLERQIGQLDSERTTLRKQLEDIASQKRQIEDKFNNLNNDVKRATQERDDLQKRYDLLDTTRQELINQIKALKDKLASAPAEVVKYVSTSAPAAAAPAVPPTTDAYWGGILKAKTDLEFQLSTVRAELKKLQISNEQLQREKANLEMDLTTLNRDGHDLKRQMEYNQKVMDSLTAELVREKNDKGMVQENMKVIKKENSVLKRQIKSLSNRKIYLESRIAELQEKNSTMEKRFDEVEVLLKDKVAQAENMKTQIAAAPKQAEAQDESVELPPITVRPQESENNVKPAARPAADPLSAFRGKVVAVNRDNNFVIVDVGQDSGLNAGDVFQAYRDDKLIAKLEVIQVRQNIAACDIKKELSSIKVGDKIR